jgi:tripartite-type tricarboxylate transporter receptor subunit TctC
MAGLKAPAAAACAAAAAACAAPSESFEAPAAVVARLAEAVKEALASEGTHTKFQQMGVDAIGSTPKEFADTLRADIAIWSEAAKAANLKME